MTVTMQVTLRVSPAVVSGDVITVTFGGGSAGGIEGGKYILMSYTFPCGFVRSEGLASKPVF